MRLADQGAKNAHRWAARAATATATAGLTKQRVRGYRRQVRRAGVSTNVSTAKIIAFDDEERVLHARELVQRGSADPSVALAEWIERSSWNPRRQAFEDLWDDGRSTVYAALNIGGMGTEGCYGPICLFIDEPEAGSRDVGVFPHNSAGHYTDPDSGFDC